MCVMSEKNISAWSSKWRIRNDQSKLATDGGCDINWRRGNEVLLSFRGRPLADKWLWSLYSTSETQHLLLIVSPLHHSWAEASHCTALHTLSAHVCVCVYLHLFNVPTSACVYVHTIECRTLSYNVNSSCYTCVFVCVASICQSDASPQSAVISPSHVIGCRHETRTYSAN